MIRLIKLHLGLILYLRAELKKKRTIKDLLRFFRDLGKRYVSVMLQEYKNVFLILDPLYRQQKAQFEQQQKAQKTVKQIFKLFQYINEDLLIKMKKDKKQRQQIRRDFYEYGKLPKDVFEQIVKEIE